MQGYKLLLDRLTAPERVMLSPLISMRLITILLAAGMMASVSAWAENNRDCGIVVGITEEWKLGDRPLTLGSVIPRSAVKNLKNKEPEPKGNLTVWFSPQPPETYQCGKTGCPIDVKDNSCAPQPGDGAAARLGREPAKYFMAASRGLEGDLKEAVLPLTGSQVDVAPAFEKLDAGEYRVRFDSLRRTTDNAPSSKLEWPRGNTAMVSASGLKADLYRLTLLDASGEPTGSEAWVLLSDAEQYAATSARFQETAKQVATWPSEVDPQAIRAILRATLESLSGPGEVSPRP